MLQVGAPGIEEDDKEEDECVRVVLDLFWM
jgi:hypothetical protein